MTEKKDKPINEVILSKNMISVTLKSVDVKIDELCDRAMKALEEMCGRD